MKIRDDLEGVVLVYSEGGVVALAAGDTVPADVEVGDHLTGGKESHGSSGSGARTSRSRQKSDKPGAEQS